MDDYQAEEADERLPDEVPHSSVREEERGWNLIGFWWDYCIILSKLAIPNTVLFIRNVPFSLSKSHKKFRLQSTIQLNTVVFCWKLCRNVNLFPGFSDFATTSRMWLCWVRHKIYWKVMQRIRLRSLARYRFISNELHFQGTVIQWKNLKSNEKNQRNDICLW